MTAPMDRARALISHMVFLADPAAESRREELHCRLIELALKEKGSGLSASEAGPAVRDMLRLKAEFPASIIDGALGRCVERGSVGKDGDLYSLTPKRSRILDRAIEAEASAREAFGRYVLSSIEMELEARLPDGVQQALPQVVEDAVSEILRLPAVELANSLRPGGRGFDANLAHGLLPDRDVSILSHLEVLFPPNDRITAVRVAEIVTQAIARARDPLVLAHLASIVHSTVFLQLLNLDPEVQGLQRSLLANRVVYLDTNVILALLFPSHTRHETVEQVVAAASRMRVALRVSPYTYQELARLLRQAAARYRRFRVRNAVTEVAVLKGDDIFLRTYLERVKKRRRLSWESFATTYQSYADRVDSKYNLTMEKEGTEVPQPTEDLMRVGRAIRDAKEKTRRWVSEAVVEHDASNFLLVHRLRETYPSDELGNRVWLLTMDKRLAQAEEYLRHDYRASHCKSPEVLFAMLLPMCSPEVTSEEYPAVMRALINSRLGALPHDPEFIQIDFYEMLVDGDLPLEELSALPPEAIARALINLQRNQEAVRLARRAVDVKGTAEKVAVDEKFRRLLHEAVREREVDREQVELLTEEIASASSETGAALSRVEALEKLAADQAAKLHLLDSIVASLHREKEACRDRAFRWRTAFLICAGALCLAGLTAVALRLF